MHCTHIEWIFSRSTGFMELVYLLNFHHFSYTLPLNKQTISSSSFSHTNTNTNVQILFVCSPFFFTIITALRVLNRFTYTLSFYHVSYTGLIWFGSVYVITFPLHLLFAYVVDVVNVCVRVCEQVNWSGNSDLVPCHVFFFVAIFSKCKLCDGKKIATTK